LYLSSGFV